MKFTRIALLSLIFSAFFFGCNPRCNNEDSRNINWKSEHSGSPEGNRQILQVQETIKRLYSTDPDSAIYHYLKAIDIYKQQQMPYNAFDAYIKISELYCFRKNDGVNAVYYYGEALKTMNKYGGYEDSNPFFYIDMGNMFYMNKLFPQAHKSFEKAINIASLKKDSFAISVAENNNGIVFREEKKFDSAIFYFNESLAIRRKINPLYEAQNYLYLAKVYTYQSTPDSIFRYRELASEALARHAASKSDSSYTVRTAFKALADGFYVYESELMAIVHKLRNEQIKALNYYQTALKLAIATEDHESCMIYLYNCADLNDKLNRKNEAINYATKAYQLAVTHQNFGYAVSTSKLLNELFAKDNNLNRANFYLNEIINYSDSLKQQETSEKSQTAKILLITNQVEDSVRHYQSQVKKHRKVVKAQSFSIVMLIFLLILMVVLLIYIYRKRAKLKQEHLRQMALFLRKLEDEEEHRKQKKGERQNYFFNELEENLLSLMETDKVYLQKNITLALLADMLNTNITYLSQYINNQLKTNFNDYINSHRIKEACRLFRNNTPLKYSVDQIADMVGFSSRTTFYSTFKKFTGNTPSFFQKYIQNPEVTFHDDNL